MKRMKRARESAVPVLVDPVEPGVLIVIEHSEFGVEQLAYDELEELFLHASLVDALLAVEDDLQRFLKVARAAVSAAAAVWVVGGRAV